MGISFAEERAEYDSFSSRVVWDVAFMLRKEELFGLCASNRGNL